MFRFTNCWWKTKKKKSWNTHRSIHFCTHFFCQLCRVLVLFVIVFLFIFFSFFCVPNATIRSNWNLLTDSFISHTRIRIVILSYHTTWSIYRISLLCSAVTKIFAFTTLFFRVAFSTHFSDVTNVRRKNDKQNQRNKVEATEENKNWTSFVVVSLKNVYCLRQIRSWISNWQVGTCGGGFDFNLMRSEHIEFQRKY